MGINYAGQISETGGAFPARMMTVPIVLSPSNYTVGFDLRQIDNINLAYERFRTDIYESLIANTCLSDYVDLLLIDSQQTGNFSALETAFTQAIAADAQTGVIDLIEFISAIGEPRLKRAGWNALDFLISQIKRAPALAPFTEELSRWTVAIADGTENTYGVFAGTSRADLMGGKIDSILKQAA